MAKGSTQGLTVNALRGTQGDRVMYQVLVPNAALNTFFTVNMDPPSEKSQRQLIPKHASEIAAYINANQGDYVLGALIYAVDRECEWVPSDMDDDMGQLTIPFGTNLKSLDGQHRRQGLNEAIEEDESLMNDNTAVLIYVESDVVKRRQMFSDMNSTPKVVSKALNVSFDDRDPFARAAKRLSGSHSLLIGNTESEAARVGLGSDKWYTLGAVFDVLKRLMVGPTGRVRLPNLFSEDAIVDRGGQFFDLLLSSRSEFSQLQGGADINVMRSQSILLSSTTLRALAGAVWLRLQEDGNTNPIMKYREGVTSLDFSPESTMWLETGFVSPGRSTPNARNQEVVQATKAIAAAIGDI